MRILVTNDDGIDATGLACLETIAAELSDDVWVVAPATEQSAKGHSVSLRDPVRLRAYGERRFSVDGTPADCVMMGIRHVLHDGPVDLVLSGVNRGANVADDITYSGTVAAAMEATLLGVPSVAMSQEYRPGETVHWDTARSFGAEVVRRALAAGWPRGVLINVNFPPVPPGDVEGIEPCRQGQHDFTSQRPLKRTDPFGRDYFWMAGWGLNVNEAPEGTDLHSLLNKRVAVTPIHLDMTHDPTLERLAHAFR
jgi:5'-nucleotidase